MNAGENTFDVIVIGAGMAGLACAAKLQKAGKKVLLLEQHKVIGGYCTNFKRKGYEFDAAIHFICGCEPGGMLHDILCDCGCQDYVRFIKLDPVMYKGVFPGRTLLIPPTIPEFTALLCEEFPHEAHGIREYFAGFERLFNTVDRLQNKRTPWAAKVLSPITHGRDLLFLLKNTNTTLEQYLDRHLSGQEVREIVSQLWAFLGVPASKLSLPFFVMAFMGYFKQGAYYIEGGAQALSNAFGKAFEENGGLLLTSTDVTKILVQGNKAVGVEAQDKRSGLTTAYRAKKIVSCADPTHTFLDLVGRERLPERFVKRLGRWTPSASAMCVYLGVDMDLPEEFQNDFDIFVNFTENTEKTFEKLRNNDPSDSIALSIYSNVWPDFSPQPGKKHVITLTTLMNLHENRMKEFWGLDDIHKRGKEYRRIKQELADKMVAQAERIIPGLKDHIEVMEAATPVTMKRYTRNLNGSIVGWENTVGQSILHRMKQVAPVRNLHMASAWTFPGGGVNGATMGGAMAADRLLRMV